MDDKEKEIVRQERARIIQKRMETAKLVDPPVKVVFNNIEDPPTQSRPSPPLNFQFNQYKFKESSDEQVPDTALRHGHVYDLPMSVVKHLNSLKIPVYGSVIDPVTKALKSIVTGYQPRFSCTQVELTDFQALTPPPKEKAKANAKNPLA